MPIPTNSASSLLRVIPRVCQSLLNTPFGRSCYLTVLTQSDQHTHPDELHPPGHGQEEEGGEGGHGETVLTLSDINTAVTSS